jgi:hypothetical protein
MLKPSTKLKKISKIQKDQQIDKNIDGLARKK